jgi:hypothetical protein
MNQKEFDTAQQKPKASYLFVFTAQTFITLDGREAFLIAVIQNPSGLRDLSRPMHGLGQAGSDNY